MMGQLSPKMRSIADGLGGRLVMWYCPGCDEQHAVSLDNPMRPGGTDCGPWAWNGDALSPTFSPSVNVRKGGRQKPEEPGRCHSIITGGVINFCGDSEHALAGQAVQMPDLPGWLCDDDTPEYRDWLRTTYPDDYAASFGTYEGGAS